MSNKIMRPIVCGAAAGLINGMFGTAGGTVIVLLFIRWIKLPEKQAFASAVVIMLALSCVSCLIYINQVPPNWHTAAFYIGGGVVGGFIGGKFFSKVREQFLRKTFAVFLIWAGVRAVFLI